MEKFFDQKIITTIDRITSIEKQQSHKLKNEESNENIEKLSIDELSDQLKEWEDDYLLN